MILSPRTCGEHRQPDERLEPLVMFKKYAYGLKIHAASVKCTTACTFAVLTVMQSSLADVSKGSVGDNNYTLIAPCLCEPTACR